MTAEREAGIASAKKALAIANDALAMPNWNQDEMICALTEISRILEANIEYLPADWLEDSSLETWFPLTAEELKRVKRERDTLQSQKEAGRDEYEKLESKLSAVPKCTNCDRPMTPTFTCNPCVDEIAHRITAEIKAELEAKKSA